MLERHHPLTREGLGESDGLTGRLDEMGVVSQTIDECCRDRSRVEDLIKGGQDEVGGHNQRGGLITGFDDAIERFGVVLTNR